MFNGPEFLSPARYLSALLDVGPDPVTGDVWVGGCWAFGFNSSPGFIWFLARVMMGL